MQCRRHVTTDKFGALLLPTITVYLPTNSILQTYPIRLVCWHNWIFPIPYDNIGSRIWNKFWSLSHYAIMFAGLYKSWISTNERSTPRGKLHRLLTCLRTVIRFGYYSKSAWFGSKGNNVYLMFIFQRAANHVAFCMEHCKLYLVTILQTEVVNLDAIIFHLQVSHALFDKTKAGYFLVSLLYI